jgi:hypothetical protein
MIMDALLVIVCLALVPFALIGLIMLIGVAIAVISTIISLIVAISCMVGSFILSLFED